MDVNSSEPTRQLLTNGPFPPLRCSHKRLKCPTSSQGSGSIISITLWHLNTASVSALLHRVWGPHRTAAVVFREQRLFEVNGFETGMILSLKGQMARPGDIPSCHNRGAGFGGFVLQNITPRAGSSVPSTTKNSSAPKFSNAKHKNPYWTPQN